MYTDIPTASATVVEPFVVAGWALDLNAANVPAGTPSPASETGVDRVEVWATPVGGSIPLFLGEATLGIPRPDVGAFFGDSRFDASGFTLTVDAGLALGDYTLEVRARSAVTGAFDLSQDIPVTVSLPSNMRMYVDVPTSGASVATGAFQVVGWALDLSAISGTGVDAVKVTATPSGGGPPIDLGTPGLGIHRPDVGAFFGSSQFDPSGFRLDVGRLLAAGSYALTVSARSTVSGAFDVAQTIPITVTTTGSTPQMYVDVPAPGAVLTNGSFDVSGWALDLGATSGTGVDAVEIQAIPSSGGPAIDLGAPTLGMSRPDVGAFLGSSQFDPSGFTLNVTTPLAAGTYTLEVSARSTVTGTFDLTQVIPVTVVSTPRMYTDVPTSGAVVTGGAFALMGWAVDLAASAGTGVDAVQVRAIPAGGGHPPILLGFATLGIHRPDVATFFGSSQFEPSGFLLNVTIPLASGDYQLEISARSTVTGTFNNLQTLPVTLGNVSLETLATGLAFPVDITHAGDGSGRLFVVLQGGQILIYDGSAIRPTPFLDISSLVSCCGEQGLLGLVFHPDYPSNGRFYVNYTDSSGSSVIAQYLVSSDPNVADPLSGNELLTISQPFANHNGGQLQFGPDGFLYISIGDGGSGGDPGNNAQNLGTLLGKILRIDVDGAAPYEIPPSNPFVGAPGAQEEIWAYGLRNPWRFSFDRLTGDLFIGDVGQNSREEIDFQPSTSPGGENYGWRLMEGTQCFNPPSGCNDGTLTLPILEYDHSIGNCSVTGGYRHRGTESPALNGIYFFADYCSGRIWGATPSLGGWFANQLLDTDHFISSFGEDESGEIYVARHGAFDGALLRLVLELAP